MAGKIKPKDKNDGVRVKLFINLRGQTLLCRGRKEFLETLEREGSITRTARKLGISYRTAWNLVNKTNAAAGCIIIETERGGKEGGSAHLTPQGRKLLLLIDRFFTEIDDLADRQTRELLQEFGPRH